MSFVTTVFGTVIVSGKTGPAEAGADDLPHVGCLIRTNISPMEPNARPPTGHSWLGAVCYSLTFKSWSLEKTESTSIWASGAAFPVPLEPNTPASVSGTSCVSRVVTSLGTSVWPRSSSTGGRSLEARLTSKSRSICEQSPSVTGSIGVSAAEFQCVRSRTASNVVFVVPARRIICASLSSG